MDPLYPLLFLVSLAGGFCQTALGFGYTVVVMLFLPMLLPSIPEAATVSCLTAVFCTIAIILQFRKAIRPKAVLWPIIAFFVMMPITNALSLVIPQAGLELILGCFLIALGLYYMFFAKDLRIAPTPGAGILAGGVSGLFGGLFSVSAPPAALYCLSVLDDKDAYMATMQFYLLTTNIYAVLVRFLSGMVTPSVWIWSGASVLGMLLGVFLGKLVYGRVKLEMLKKWIYVFIALMGAWTVISHFLKI